MTNRSNQAIQFAQLVQDRQNDICEALADVDGGQFREDIWERPGGGGGKTRIITGEVIEKGGVNTSEVFGHLKATELPMFNQLIQRVDSTAVATEDSSFYATGISLVIHPHNPHVPTVHANFRYFDIQLADRTLWWIGGGADLTPYILYEDDAIHFHTTLKSACDGYDPSAYPKFKLACDDYFYLPHRQETRGIGGIFFDYLTHDFDALHAFVGNAATAFLDAYVPIILRRKDITSTPAERNWQGLRRGRYAEFNLLHDRGTLFGLKTNGRIESILMSMPPVANWAYNHTPQPGSAAANLMTVLKTPRDWAGDDA